MTETVNAITGKSRRILARIGFDRNSDTDMINAQRGTGFQNALSTAGLTFKKW